MTKRLLLTIALGAALAVAAAGTATSVTVGGVKVQVPSGSPLPACSDLGDNDGDGKVDLLDPGCSGPLDTDEYNPPPSTGGGGGSGSTGSSGGTGSTGTSGGGTGTTSGGTTGTTATGTGKKKGGASKGLFGKKAPGGGKGVGKAERKKIEQPPLRNPDGSPTPFNPGLTRAQFGPAPIGVPNFVIDQFEIPPFLLPLFQSYGAEYGIPWQVLASISKHESDHCRLTDLISSAGAVGCMQFLPSTWRAYGCDGNEDGVKDPYNPVDSICAAARYLRAAGGQKDLRAAIFAYNHADWYVDLILSTANQYGKLPSALIGSLTGISEGLFPVARDATYADDLSEREALRRSWATRKAGGGPPVVNESPTRRGINIYSSLNAPVIAVNDGVIQDMGQNAKLGKYIVLGDAYGNRYTYARLGSISQVHPVPKESALTAADFRLVSPKKDAKPKAPATAGEKRVASRSAAAPPAASSDAGGPHNTEELRARLFALPERPSNIDRASVTGQLDALLGKRVPGYETFKSYFGNVFKFDRSTMELRPLKVGSKVTAGTVLGHTGEQPSGAEFLNFSIRPAGRGAKKIDPKPVLDSWKLNETIGTYRAANKDPFGPDASVGQILLMSKEILMQRVLANPRLEIYACGRTDIASGQIDRRTLATMEYLTARGYRLTITSLKCGHSFYTTSGNVSAHSYGAAVDIAEVNGLSILGNQGRGSITEMVIRDLLLLQGTMAPNQIISLMDFGGPTFAMADHADHIHVGFGGSFSKAGSQLAVILKPEQWQRLIERLGELDNPELSRKPSKFSLPAGARADDRASDAHLGE